MLKTFVLVLTAMAVVSLAQAPHMAREPATPKVIGADKPVFLGRITVVATPLPR